MTPSLAYIQQHLTKTYPDIIVQPMPGDSHTLFLSYKTPDKTHRSIATIAQIRTNLQIGIYTGPNHNRSHQLNLSHPDLLPQIDNALQQAIQYERRIRHHRINKNSQLKHHPA